MLFVDSKQGIPFLLLAESTYGVFCLVFDL